MEPTTEYSYQPLADPTAEIRLVDLLPGEPGTMIRVRITVTATKPKREPKPRMTLQALRRALPQGYRAYQTPEGRFVFDFGGSSSWNLPFHNFNHSLYQGYPDQEAENQEPMFEALSYEWGKPENGYKTILVESSSSSQARSLLIGTNLAVAFEHLRYRDKLRRLWVDAICINQKDNAEKSEQVKRMGAIYATAYRVIAWLGPARNDNKPEKDENKVAISTSLAMSTLIELGAQVLDTTDGRILPCPDATHTTWYHNATDLPYSPVVWESLCYIVDRSWFERLWVMQEICLANHRAIFQCGDDIVLKYILRRAIQCLAIKNNLPHSRLRINTEFVRSSVQDIRGCRLPIVIRMHQNRQCTNPRDKIYGLLALMPPKFSNAIVPDYESDVSETYRKAFLAHIHTTRRWELFGVDTLNRDLKTAPSWVPDFPLLQSNGNSPEYHFSSGFSRLEYSYSDTKPGHLTMLGLCCTTVRTASSQVPNLPNSIQEAIEAVQSWAPANLYDAKYVTGESLLDAYAITLVYHALRERHPTEGLWPTLDEWKAHASGRWWGADPTSPLDADGESKAGSYFDTLAYNRCRGRIFMTTDDGYIGLGPTGAQPGDMICVMLGCSHPVVLRPNPDGTFFFLGDSFVYGLHDAIPFLGPIPHPWVVQVHKHPHHLSRRTYRFCNTATGELTMHDPRLQRDPSWEILGDEPGRELTGDDPDVCAFFRKRATGEVIDSDPRMFSEVLRAEGVNLRSFTLV